MTLKIITNNHWRPIIYGFELPKKWRKEFDWIKDDEEYDCHSFIRYKNWYYSLNDFMRIDKNSYFPDKWHGYRSDSYFSGLLVELSDCGEAVKVGTYIS